MHVVQPRGRPSAVVVVAHGLNQHAFGLRPLYDRLVARGAAAVVLEFRGHGREPRDPPPDAVRAWREVTSRDWANDWLEAVDAAATLASAHEVALTFLGYSLGALVHVHQLGSAARIPGTFARQVLLAPAIRVHSRTRAVRLFRVFGPRFLVPSIAPRTIRSHDTTSVAAYDALFELEESLDRLPYPERLGLPTTIVTDPGDELVSVPRMQAFVRRHGLEPHWRFEPIAKDATTAQSRLRHYITDATGLGIRAFDSLDALVAERLLG